MNIIRVTKEFTFEMAHALHGYDGPCKNIHGHSYKLSVTVTGKPSIKRNDPKLGMVIDFTRLKAIIENTIIKPFDHSLVLNKNTPHRLITKHEPLLGKIVLTSYQPTCENLLVDFATKIKKELPGNIKLHHLKLSETPTSFAEWYTEDNHPR